MTPAWLQAATVGVFGAIVGSFLNVVIVRLPRGESLVRPGSRCPSCGTPIAWYDNVPVLSWLVLRGRCRKCAAPISLRYPVVELASATLALAAFQRFGAAPDALFAYLFFALLLVITYIDLEHWLILHALTWPGIALGLGWSLVSPRLAFWESAAGGAVGFALFWAVSIVGEKVLKKEAMGAGDKWLLAMIGSSAGIRQLAAVILIASATGAVVGILLILGRRGQPPPPPPQLPTPPGAEPEEPWQPPAHAVPFGPFLSLAGMIVVLFGERLHVLRLVFR